MKHFSKILGWGLLLWLIGYVLGILLFFVVPAQYIGWVIAPIGSAVTLWVLFKKIRYSDWGSYIKLGLLWTVIAVVLDYLFIVLLLHPIDGYYKADVFLYYALTLILPIGVGWYKTKKTAVSYTS